ncbi:MAG: hypothetical protein ACRD03_00245 [Acidimicrobiales bacterium]
MRTARDRMIVTWLADSGLRVGELTGPTACQPLGTHGAHQMLQRAGRRAEREPGLCPNHRRALVTAGRPEGHELERRLAARIGGLVSELMGHLREPDGTWLAHEGERLCRESEQLLAERNQLVGESDDLRRRLDGARAQVSRADERRVAELFPDGPGPVRR